jgi:MFS family permease
MGIPFAILAFLSIPEIPKATIPLITKARNKGSVLRLFKNTPVLFVIYGLVFLTMFFLYANVIFIPKLVEGFGTVNPFFIGILLSVMGLAGAITAFTFGKIRAKLSYIEIIVIATLFWVFGFAIMSQASSTWVAGIAIVLFGFGIGLIMPTAMVWTGESVPEAFRGRMLSYLASAGFVGQFMSPIILSPIASSLGLDNVFIIIAGVSALLFIAFLVYSRKQSNS